MDNLDENLKDSYLRRLVLENKYLKQKLESIESIEHASKKFVEFIKQQDIILNEAQKQIAQDTDIENLVISQIKI